MIRPIATNNAGSFSTCASVPRAKRWLACAQCSSGPALGAATDREPAAAADGIGRYGDLKESTAEAVIELLRPLQARYHELAADPAETGRLLALGADQARTVASATLDRMRSNLGLLPR